MAVTALKNRGLDWVEEIVICICPSGAHVALLNSGDVFHPVNALD
jgi:hypothetical protein